MDILSIVNEITIVIGIIGVVVITWGVIIAALELCYGGFLTLRRKSNKFDKEYLRRQLGSYLLLGLEFMIAADTIHTFIKPGKDELIVLGSIVVIRTIISYFLNREIQSKV